MGDSDLYVSRLLKLQSVAKELAKSFGLEISYAVTDVPPYTKEEPHLFGRFPWYYDLVSRGRAFYVHSPESFLFGVALSWTKGVNGCLRNRVAILRPEVAEDKFGRFVDFVSQLRQQLQTGVVVKHVGEDLANRLCKEGFRYYNDDEGWSDLAKEDDQTWQEVVLDMDAARSAPEDSARGAIKNDVHAGRYSLDGLDVPACIGTEWRRDTREIVTRVFYKWVALFHARRAELVDRDFLTWHLMAFETLTFDGSVMLFVLKDAEDATPAGVFAVTPVGEQQTDVVFSFIGEERGNFQRVAYGFLIAALRKRGYRWLNLGGSETKSLFDFKASLGSHKLLGARHLLVD